VGLTSLAPLKTLRGEHERSIILKDAREQLAEEIVAYREPKPMPLKISPWLAMSLLQKAIRRNESDLAQFAAANRLRVVAGDPAAGPQRRETTDPRGLGRLEGPKPLFRWDTTVTTALSGWSLPSRPTRARLGQRPPEAVLLADHERAGLDPDPLGSLRRW
jgi:hypothetical protein